MRIAMIAETFTTGVGRHITDLTTSLCRRGHEVHVLYGHDRHDPALVAETRSLPSAHALAMPMRRAPCCGDVRALWSLHKYLHQHGPFDVIHGHSAKGGAFARFLALALRTRCLYTPHALVTLTPDLHWPKKIFYRLIEWGLAQLTDVIVCCSWQ